MAGIIKFFGSLITNATRPLAKMEKPTQAPWKGRSVERSSSSNIAQKTEALKSKKDFAAIGFPDPNSLGHTPPSFDMARDYAKIGFPDPNSLSGTPPNAAPIHNKIYAVAVPMSRDTQFCETQSYDATHMIFEMDL